MDIVEQLRKHVNDRGGASLENGAWSMMLKGADEIEQLRKDYALAWENHLLHEQIFVLTEAKIERLREALQLIVRHPAEKTGEYKVGFREVRLVAAKALQQKDSE